MEAHWGRRNRARDDGWDIREAGVALLRFAMLFGLCAAALAVMASPSLKRNQEWSLSGRGLDTMTVGSIPNKRHGGQYRPL